MIARARPRAIFIDDGGVMNDNERRGADWRRLLGEYLSARLGGDADAWSQANVAEASRLWAEYERHIADPYLDWAKYWAEYEDDWLRSMCARVGVAAPLDARAVTRACSEFVVRQVRAAIPGAIDAIRRMYAAGFALYAASGEPSWDLDGYLDGMGVRSCFTTLYGPDLVNTAKSSPLFYERIFARSGLDAQKTMVVDDSVKALDWAMSIGATTVLCHDGPPREHLHVCIPSLSELPELLGA